MDSFSKICRVCLDENAQTSIYSTEFAMMPCTMLMICAKIRVDKADGLPAVICNNCIYRLGVAYHFKQECESSDIRLRQYLGLTEKSYGFTNTATNTEQIEPYRSFSEQQINEVDRFENTIAQPIFSTKKSKVRSRYQRKPAEQHKRRGPKALPKLPQSCFECNKSFKCAAQLQQHMRTHTGEKPFHCNFCNQRFAQKYNLTVHERTHTGERPFQCEICSKQFSAAGNFHAHQKIHAGVRDQICPLCQKSFFTGGDLTKHLATHEGAKNHCCSTCGKSFRRQRDMQLHKRKFHASAIQNNDRNSEDTDSVVVETSVHDQFKCPICHKIFNSADSLSLHFRIHATNNLISLPLPVPVPMSHSHLPYNHASQSSLQLTTHEHLPAQASNNTPQIGITGHMTHILSGPSSSADSRYTLLHPPQRLHY